MKERCRGEARFLTYSSISAVRGVHLLHPMQSLASAGLQLGCQALPVPLALMEWAALRWKLDKGQQFMRHRPKSICNGTHARALLGL